MFKQSRYLYYSLFFGHTRPKPFMRRIFHNITNSYRPTVPISGSKDVLHKFPNPAKNKDRFNTWVYSVGGEILGLSNDHIFKYRRVCHQHFEEKYWCRNNLLSNIAVPTTNMPGQFYNANISVYLLVIFLRPLTKTSSHIILSLSRPSCMFHWIPKNSTHLILSLIINREIFVWRASISFCDCHGFLFILSLFTLVQSPYISVVFGDKWLVWK